MPAGGIGGSPYCCPAWALRRWSEPRADDLRSHLVDVYEDIDDEEKDD
ncbi:hypothetical protein [Embleya sp. MST-111070]